MAQSRHRAAPAPLRVRVRKLVVPATLATVITGGAIGIGLSPTGGAGNAADLTAAKAEPLHVEASQQPERTLRVSRTAPRTELEPEAVDKVYATAELNVWAKPSDAAKRVGSVDSGTKLAVTGKVVSGWAEVLIKGEVRYVNADYLSEKKPADDASTGSTGSAGSAGSAAGVSAAPCPDGSGTESGLTSSAVTLFRAVCNAFPELTTYGGWDDHGEHASGKAIDFMVSSPALGQAVANWIRAHAAELNLYDVIWAQHIYTQQRGGEGWRMMSDRGSETANHYDHVHASVY